jgi:hypothetical protein
MVPSATPLVKRGLVTIGAVLPERAIYDLNGVVNYLEVGAFVRRRGFPNFHRFATKHEVWDVIARELGDQRVLYMEFGVADGASIRHWSRLLRNPESLLHGFDSFEGLPTDWILRRPAGYFSTEGHLPEIQDERVTFIKGWFNDTLPSYVWPEGFERLVVNMDADLYTSTARALAAVEGHLVPGSFVYFDEFNQRAHEMQAFAELLDRSGMKFVVSGATRDLAHVAFRRVS